MPGYKYLIIGGGMTGDASVKGIRRVDKSGSIGIISSENHPPYNRPPLSKGLWKGTPLEQVWRRTPTENMEIHLSRTAKDIDVKKKVVIDDKARIYSFDKLLLATGGKIRTLPLKVDGIIYFRTLDDYQRLRSLADSKQTFAVIGGGFIGSEVAAALAMNNKKVVMIFPEDGIGARVFPRDLSLFLNDFYRTKGVEVVTQQTLAYILKRNSSFVLKTSGGRELVVDGIVAGIGIEPDVELARSADLKIENGITVNEFLQTSHPDIYAAGDVANFFNPALGKRVRVEHEDNANTMGEFAGRNMAGERNPYDYLPFFYSDLFELGYEAVGELDVRYETVQQWKEKFQEGVVYYLQDGRVRGVLLWNTWGQVETARKLIAEKGPFNAQNVKGRLPA